MQGVEQPERIATSPAGDVATFIVPARGDAGAGVRGVWLGPTEGAPRRVSERVPDTPVAFAPDGSQFAFGFQNATDSTIEIRSSGEESDREPTSVSLPGFAEALAWSSMGLFAVAAEPGADSAALHSGRPLAGADADPRVVAGAAGWRRVWQIDPDDRVRARPITPRGPTIWEFAPVSGGGIVALCSDDPSEDGWYRPYLALFAGGSAPGRILYRSSWQLSSPTVDPAGERIAFIEGWASDRGLLAGEVRWLGLRDTQATPRALDAGVDVTWLSWEPTGRLWLAGWDHLGTAWGSFDGEDLDATPTLHREHAGCVNSRWHPEVAPIGTGDALTVRSTADAAPEVVRLTAAGEHRPWSALNGAARERTFAMRELRWNGPAGLEIEGLLALPAATGVALPPLVVDIHGGPSIAWHHGWSLTWAEVLTEAGFAVLMPNYRGSVGRGQAFGRSILGDPAGAELEDVIAGVRHCAAVGLIDDRRVGAIGASYGGYLAAWAACRSDVFGAGVVIAGVTDLVSCRGTANNSTFYDRLLNGSPREVGSEYLQRSPVCAVDGRTSPTLILHGEEDRCVPLGQAQELHHALRSAGVATELVTYPREGHIFLERAHLDDHHRRAVNWLTTHLVAR